MLGGHGREELIEEASHLWSGNRSSINSFDE